ncbi:hypothetical protein PRIPAC_74778 [Pristionchus pacificus]|uniref:Uncharacterized protein n=1 Tax=Pristionchus pacificus TaxID=54126 RepID=A0A2A6C868_PRIPA|nr:hypothetical protein PRIPAC_74778 [Pristionchus pacificus]|eukprot:PDM74402.1 hypothetical protein PRIPAC_41758 [Pristionchus pacificus]
MNTVFVALLFVALLGLAVARPSSITSSSEMDQELRELRTLLDDIYDEAAARKVRSLNPVKRESSRPRSQRIATIWG